jgi:hypothetical protein
VVNDLVMGNRCNIVCIQKTKLHSVNVSTILATLGQNFIDHFTVLPADGTKGGIILACSQEYYSMSQIEVRQFSVTVTIKRKIDNEEWTLTGVYGP